MPNGFQGIKIDLDKPGQGYLRPHKVAEIWDFQAFVTKIQQTMMLVTCQRFGDWFLSGLVWPYSSIQKNIMKVGSKSLLLTCSSNKF